MTVSLSVKDARKYVNDIDSNLDLRLTSANAQGNFKNFESILSWLKYNNHYNGNAIVRNADSHNSTVDELELDFKNQVVIDGENEADLYCDYLTLGSNITLKNLNLTISSNVNVIEQCENVIFDNCNITIDKPVNDSLNILFNFVSSNNIKFKNTNFSVNFINSVPQYSGGIVFNISNTDNFEFIGGSVIASYNVNFDDRYSGNIFSIDNSNNINIVDSDFSGNFLQYAIFDNCNKININNCTISTNYSINVSTGTGYLGYNPNYNVNTGHGILQFNCANSLNNVNINDVKFNFTSRDFNLLFNRFSFIDFSILADDVYLNDIKINNCKFTSKNNNTLSIDYLPAISVINNENYICYMNDVYFTKNICNSKQSIIISTKPKLAQIMGMSGPLIKAIMQGGEIIPLNVNVNNNSCGVIGWWTGNKSTNPVGSESSSLFINNNKCNLICNIDGNGYMFSTVDKIGDDQFIDKAYYESSNVIINNNMTNWIFTSISQTYNKKTIKITNNHLKCDEKSILIRFRVSNSNYNLIPTSSDVSNIAISVFCDEISSVQDALIEGNNIDSAIIFGSTYFYSNSCIYSMPSCTIVNNIVSGIDSNKSFTGGNSLISFCGRHSIVKNNKLDRKSGNISAYISFRDFIFGWDGITDTVSFSGTTLTDIKPSGGIINDNYLDSPYINDGPYPFHPKTEIGLFNEEKVIIVPLYNLSGRQIRGRAWIVRDNKNQTEQCALEVAGGAGFLLTDGITWNISSSASSLEAYLISASCQISKYLPNGSKVITVHAQVLCNKNMSHGVTLRMNKFVQNSEYLVDYGNSNVTTGLLRDSVPYVQDIITTLKLDCTQVTLGGDGYIDNSDPTYSSDSDFAIVGAGYEIACTIVPSPIDKDDSTEPGDDILLTYSPLFVKYRY